MGHGAALTVAQSNAHVEHFDAYLMRVLLCFALFSRPPRGCARLTLPARRGIMEYMDCQLPGLCFPLVALIDYMGYRLMAASILPIDRSTLVYGSQDGGRTIASQRDEAVARLVARAAARLRVAQHVLRDGAGRAHTLWSCVDLEVSCHAHRVAHRIADARAGASRPRRAPVSAGRGARHAPHHSAPAAARLQPVPSVPVRVPSLHHSYRIALTWASLRSPEFVAQYAEALCPEAYGGWPLENRAALEAAVDRATQALLGPTVTRLAAQLDALGWGGAPDDAR